MGEDLHQQSKSLVTIDAWKAAAGCAEGYFSYQTGEDKCMIRYAH